MLPTLDAPELIFGLCSPIGTQNALVADLIESALLKYHYRSEKYKVTSLMKEIGIKGYKLKTHPIDERYDTHIKYANKLRELTNNDVLAAVCCAKIRSFRRGSKSKADSYIPNQAYIFDQFKRKEEIETMRQVYGRLFILVSIYSDKDNRIRSLAEKIAESHAVSRPNHEHENLSRKLVLRDEDEDGVPSGQRIRDTFPLADVFLNIDDIDDAKLTLDRFLDALFGSNRISPTRDEYAMYIAKSASFRSLDLSRQVGAAIFSPQCEIISLGCNEVPRHGGGTYWFSDPLDRRDYTIERDENERIKRSILADVVRRLLESDHIQSEKKEDELVSFVLSEASRKGTSIREAQLMDLLEFGRIIHAEMSAITDASRSGLSTKGATLYCTTFPCHICAKHIIAAGIMKVLYIEPYPKSYAEDLHRDAISLGVGSHTGEKVKFSPFIGISPYRFRELFERSKRKDQNGKFSQWTEGKPKPIIKYTVATYLTNEAAVTKLMEINLKAKEESGEIALSR